MRIFKYLLISALLIILNILPVWAGEINSKYFDGGIYREIVSVPVGEDYFVINGVNQSIETPVYVTDEGIMMVPLRSFLSLCDVDVDEINWYPDTQVVRVIFLGGGRTAFFTSGTNSYQHNEYTFNFENGKSELINNVFYMPVRAFGNTFGFEVFWDSKTSSAVISERVTQ